MNAAEKEKLERALEDIPTFDNNSIKHITCSNCNKRLLDIIKNEANLSLRKTLLQVECPFCKDMSFEQEIQGEFWMGDCDGVEQVDIDWQELELDKNRPVGTGHNIKNCKILVKTRKKG